MASSRKPRRDNGKAAPARGKGSATSRACVRALIGAATALVPVSCSSTEGLNPVGGSGGATQSTTSYGTGGTGGMSGGTGGMMADGGDASDGTLVDLDGEADAPHLPPDAAKPDADAS